MNNADIVARATEAVDFFTEAVKQLPTGSWDLPSNLEGWSIRDLVAHTTGTVNKIVAVAEGGQPAQGPADPDDWRSDDPVGQLHELAGRLHAAHAGADLDSQALTTIIVGLSIHAWDVYRSLHQPVELPDALLAFCQQVAEVVPEDTLRRPGVFGPAQPVSDHATPTARLMAFYGRPV
jgi:uncharacterized protein (TIGR03086 family)